MEYLAKIFQEHKLESLWKYEFLDIQTNKQDCFYHDQQISYDPNVTGKLTLNADKFFQSFEKEVIEEKKRINLDETFAKLDWEVDKKTKNFLNDLPKKYRKVSIEPEHLKHLRELGFSHEEIGNVYERCERTIYRWFNPSTEPLQKRGVKPKISEEVINLVRSYTLENKIKTQQEVANYVYEKLGVVLSQPSICVLLKKLGITYKKLTYHYTQLDEEKARKFNEEIKPLLLNNVPFIAIDECSFYPNQDPRFGYSLKGERVIERKPGHKGKHYTLLFAISNQGRNGVIKWKLTGEKVNWKVFYDFLEEINPVGDKTNILLIDNSRVHTAPNKREEAKVPSIEGQMLKKNIEVRFITPYAPMLDPAELVFCLLRQQTEKQRPRSFKEIELAVKKVVDLLNTKDLRKYFWHCATYFDRKDAKIKLKITDI